MVYPQKHTILGERGNTLLTTEEAIEEALNADESPVEMQAWGDMICSNDVNVTGSDQGEVGDAGETAADDAVEGESESKDDDRDEEGGTHHTLASIPSQHGDAEAKASKAKSTRKPSHKHKPPSEELDPHLAAFVHNSLLQSNDLRKGCRHKVLNFLYENYSVGEQINCPNVSRTLISPRS